MKRKILLICLFVASVLPSMAQTTTVTQYANFYTNDQSLWMQGNSGLLDLDIPFFDVSWNESGSIGGITTIAGYPFGAVVNAGTWGQIGSGLRIEFGTEKVDVVYNTDVNLTMPADGTFEKGDEITISTALDPHENTSSITRDEYNVIFQIWMAIGFGFDIGGQFCFFDCTNGTIVDIDLPVDTFNLVYLDSTGVSLLEGLWEWPFSNLPISFSDNEDIVTLTLDLPSNANDSSWFSGNNMISASRPYEYASLEFNVCKFIGALNIPYVSAVFANLENEWELGPVTIGYTLMDMVFKLGLYHNQRLTFSPTVKTTLTFPGNIDYKVLKPDNNVLSSGTASSITLDVGNKLRFRYPCNYDFMDIDPYYVMRNNFNNHTYDSIAFDFIFDMLEFHVSMDDIEVIPEICIPIYYPCGPWYCVVCDWCYDGDICTPAVVFHGFNWGFGPLVHLQPNIFNVKYNWVNSNWEMQDFNDVDGDIFRITPARFEVSVAPSDAPCFGINGGSAIATVTHGKPPYRYEWSNGTVHTNVVSLTDAVSNLPAGTHYVIVTDINGCVTFCSFVIGQPEAALTIDAISTNISCNGTPSGSINISTSGGTTPYSFNWSNGATTEDITNVTAGTYILTVTDSLGCTNVSSYTLTEPYPLISTASSTNPGCYGAASGFAAVSSTGGTPPYNYLWNTGDTTQSISNITAGAYSVTVTDFNGCENILTYAITQPADPVSIIISTQDVFCNGESSGSVTVSASGGTAPYQYDWFRNGQSLNHTAANLGNIDVGDYRVIVTDANGCTKDTTVHISEPPAIEFNVAVVNNLCFGETNGSISLSVNGGTGTYTYNWSNGASTQNIGTLPAGTYQVTITDNNGCHQYAEAIITQPGAPLTATAEPTHVLCKGNNTGVATLNPQGGTAPYFFLWSNGSTNQNPTGLTAGTYTVTITDNNGCIAYSGTVIEEPGDSLAATFNISDALCFGSSDGNITAMASGGTTPYYIRWDDTDYLMQNNGHKIENLYSGYYQIIVTDANGCKSAQTLFVNQPDSIHSSAIEGITSCWGGNDGTIDLSASGGTAPYGFIWSNGQTSEDVSSAETGTYSVTITDDHGCTKTATYHIGTMPEIIVNASVVQVSCSDNADGQITLIVSGGAGSYNYLWSNEATSYQLSNLEPGSYSVTVSDLNGCTKIIEYTLPESETECINIPTSFTPNSDGKNDDWVINNIDLYPGHRVQIFNRWGNLLYEQSPYTTPWDGKFNGNPLPAETYYYIIDLNNGQEAFTGTVTIIR
ncbi:MAG: gliding motility-associated C-terminal domain-containing protein [Bacteroidales bacterium]